MEELFKVLSTTFISNMLACYVNKNDIYQEELIPSSFL